MTMTGIRHRLFQPTDAFPLAIFRIAFGLLMAVSQIRFLYRGWVKELYLAPSYHFTYPGFTWVSPLPEFWMYLMVYATILLALLIAAGLFYRISIILFFLSFTYLELIDKAWYLNHYYFISLVAFLLIFIPAHRRLSLDRKLFKMPGKQVPNWAISTIRLQLGIVYFFAGIAKIKYDWLILAQPMKIWLGARSGMPVLGSLFNYEITPYIFSWAGMIYDLSIPFLLLNRKTRPLAYIAVIVFHLLTYALFNIGMFPWVMMASTLIFFEMKDWKKLFPKIALASERPPKVHSRTAILCLLVPYFILQITLPLRHFFHPGNVLENEKGLRFAWHVMVMEKNGHVEYRLEDTETGKSWLVLPSLQLTLAQEKQMSFQPDMIIQYGKYLREEYRKKTGRNCLVSARNWTALNGRKSVLTEYNSNQF